uniref:Fucosyltransferase n=1 Tax=Panagrolaimus davidi TaxID=227884 RepID=A0A914QMS9_9BILA
MQILLDAKLSTSITKIRTKLKPIIIEWNEYAWKNISYIDYECGKKCIFTRDRKLEEYATVITFHVGSMQLWNYPKTQSESRMHVFVNFEPPTNAPILVKLPEDFFNYTISYRWDSDVTMSYGCFHSLEGKNDTNKWEQRERELIIEKLQTYINITNYGKCFNSKYNPDPDTSKFYFVIAFENAHCTDYITEKIWRLRDMTVPIILDRSQLRGKYTTLNPYVIAVTDFKNIKELGDYLNFLMKNHTEYRKYLDWTKFYKKSYGCFFLNDMPCVLCDLALKITNGFRKQNNVRKWWQEEVCIEKYAEKLLLNQTMNVSV